MKNVYLMRFVKVILRNSIIDLINREGEGTKSVHVINIEIKDNHAEAQVGGKIIHRLAVLVCF